MIFTLIKELHSITKLGENLLKTSLDANKILMETAISMSMTINEKEYPLICICLKKHEQYYASMCLGQFQVYKNHSSRLGVVGKIT